MPAYKFFFTILSLLACSSLSRCSQQPEKKCFTDGKVDPDECANTFNKIEFSTGDAVMAGEKNITVASGGCLIEIIATDSGAATKTDIGLAMWDVFAMCPNRFTGIVPKPAFTIYINEIKPDTPIFGSNVKLNKPFCKIKSQFKLGDVKSKDCIEAIGKIKINKASPQNILAQSRGTIETASGSCLVRIRSSNELDITLNHDQLKKMSLVITDYCKQNSGAVVQDKGAFGLNSRTEMRIFFNGKPGRN
ncbi:hypothetical protein PGT21_021108 [Puccinia graminis f. sp. tritici]|uniref:Uncharacterized protein n=1 Tax=Puccinia graminis f. sp. tritici TaxID=56615 RepID=A0A5B0MRV5_PUCGR|nr:hypothetical protein PGT21_021108 [Puccinia graminis f. sp. tritici]